MLNGLAKQLQFGHSRRYVLTMRQHLNPKTMIRSLLLTILAIVASIALAERWMESESDSCIYRELESLPECKVGLVLGCAQNVYFHYRVHAAYEVYKAGKIAYILVSGDNHIATYDEAGAMKSALVNRGVPEDRVICDYAGFSTIDSIVRAREVFGQHKITIISQEFHVQRALFIAKRKQVDAIGYCAPDVETSIGTRTQLREAFARVKTILDLYLLHRQPRFLGDPVPVGIEEPASEVIPDKNDCSCLDSVPTCRRDSIMDIALNILKEILLVTVTMAPYLLFGFLMAGVLSVLISQNYVRRHLGGSGWLQSIKAALLGVPLPICSCGVIPLAASLRKHGASRGATASFLASTPQTGIDSLMITYALLGWIYAIFRAVVAFVSGILCGMTVSAVSPKRESTAPECTEECCQPQNSHPIKRILSYGFIALPRDIARAMVLGIVISGIISGLVPENFFADRMGDSVATMFLMLLIGIPLYVCSSGSVPIALAFIKAGISPGAALIFLITGPATNAATLTTLWEIIGRKQLVVFLITLSLCALTAGFLMNSMELHLGVIEYVCKSDTTPGRFEYLCALILVGILFKGMLPEKRKATCCNT